MPPVYRHSVACAAMVSRRYLRDFTHPMPATLVRHGNSTAAAVAAFPKEPTWSLSELKLTADHAPPLTDDDVVRSAKLAHLSLPPIGSPAFAEVKAGIASVLAAATACAPTYVVPHPAVPVPGAQDPVDRVADNNAAKLRMQGLREDVVAEGGDAAAVVSFAARRDGLYFVVPKIELGR